MEIKKIKDILDLECPKTRNVYIYHGKKENEEDLFPSGWDFFTYRGNLGIQTFIAEETLLKLNEESIKVMARMLNCAFDTKESSSSSPKL